MNQDDTVPGRCTKKTIASLLWYEDQSFKPNAIMKQQQINPAEEMSTKQLACNLQKC